jgi:hypothetical protein
LGINPSRAGESRGALRLPPQSKTASLEPKDDLRNNETRRLIPLLRTIAQTQNLFRGFDSLPELETQFLAPANSSSKSTISLICTRNQRSIFVRLKISSMVKPARRAWH